MLQAPVFEGLSFDAPTLFESLVTSTEVNIHRVQVPQPLVIAMVIIVLDEVANRSFKIAG